MKEVGQKSYAIKIIQMNLFIKQKDSQTLTNLWLPKVRGGTDQEFGTDVYTLLI